MSYKQLKKNSHISHFKWTNVCFGYLGYKFRPKEQGKELQTLHKVERA